MTLPRPLRGLRTLYRAAVPDAVRYPIGHARRSLVDAWTRLRAGGPLPPRRLLRSVQMTPWIWEYLRVGEVTAAAVRDAFDDGAGLDAEPGARSATDRPAVLDFGCGLGRTLRFLRDAPWSLHGCDVDGESIEWARGAYPGIRFEVNGPDPPLPYAEATFDAVYAISVFTHFDAAAQASWAAEMGRVVRPGGLALVTTMGEHALGYFPNLDTEESRRDLEEQGFLYRPGGEAFNARGAFHTPQEVERLFAGHFDLLRHEPAGVDGFQDLGLLRRKETEKVTEKDAAAD